MKLVACIRWSNWRAMLVLLGTIVWIQASGRDAVIDSETLGMIRKYPGGRFPGSSRYELSIKSIFPSALGANDIGILVAYSAAENPARSIDVLFTFRKKKDCVEMIEDVALFGGCSTTEVAELRVAIREQILPSGPMFLTYVDKTSDTAYAATYVTDAHPLGGSGADVNLVRCKSSGKLKVTSRRAFKR